MDKEVYIGRRVAIERSHREALSALDREFALSNSPVKIGDKITGLVAGKQVTIIIDRVGVSRHFGQALPQCVYIGRRLAKNGEPRKDGANEFIWQDCLTKF